LYLFLKHNHLKENFYPNEAMLGFEPGLLREEPVESELFEYGFVQFKETF